MSNILKISAVILCLVIMLMLLIACANPTETNQTPPVGNTGTEVETEVETEAETMALMPSTDGLAFEINSDGVSYTCLGIGVCTENVIIIDTYEGLPVTHIAQEAFANHKALTGVTIGESVKDIGNSAFRGCLRLSDISLPENIIKIGMEAFQDTKYFKSASNWNNKSLYMNRCFIRENQSSQQCFILDGTLTIATAAFAQCQNLESVTIPSSVTFIGGFAFMDCRNLKSVTIPNSITSMGEAPFLLCLDLTDIYFTGTEEEWNAINGITQANIPQTTTIHYNYQPE